jgi:hypothetical protein
MNKKSFSLLAIAIFTIGLFLINGCSRPHCGNGVQDGDETGVDCGGSCNAITCQNGGTVNGCGCDCLAGFSGSNCEVRILGNSNLVFKSFILDTLTSVDLGFDTVAFISTNDMMKLKMTSKRFSDTLIITIDSFVISSFDTILRYKIQQQTISGSSYSGWGNFSITNSSSYGQFWYDIRRNGIRMISEIAVRIQ